MFPGREWSETAPRLRNRFQDPRHPRFNPQTSDPPELRRQARDGKGSPQNLREEFPERYVWGPLPGHQNRSRTRAEVCVPMTHLTRNLTRISRTEVWHRSIPRSRPLSCVPIPSTSSPCPSDTSREERHRSLLILLLCL